MFPNRLVVEDIVKRALGEDVGTGDVTTALIIPDDARAAARMVAKEQGVIAGLPVVCEVYRQVDPCVAVSLREKDGAAVNAGAVLAEISGPAASILVGERVALNFVQRLSGVATATNLAARELAGTKTRLLDTRKTTPGLRSLEKYAVAVGGGTNHRFGLYDAVLIKDNHIAVAGGITQAVEAARRSKPMTMKIEVEVESMAGVEEALRVGADIIMLDNMELPVMAQAVALINGRALVEASGRIGVKVSAADVAATGVDYVSMGSLTYASRALDISLDIDPAGREG